MAGNFKILKITPLLDFEKGLIKELPESDLCLQSGNSILQFEYVEKDDIQEKFQIKPGIFTLTDTASGVKPVRSELQNKKLLETVSNTSKIIGEAKLFFNNLDIYEKLERAKKRGVLLYSKPGMGKSSAITKFCEQLINEDPGTVIFNWPTSDVYADKVAKLLSMGSEYTKECTKLVLIIEDIGGGEHERHDRGAVESGLLNLLDGINVTFKLPTFIVATTNYPENLLSALADRPGRFDLMIELGPPSADEKVQLLEFIAKRSLSNEEKERIVKKDAAEFSVAHLEEVVIRSMLHKKTIMQVVDELIEHRKRFDADFQKLKKGPGISPP